MSGSSAWREYLERRGMPLDALGLAEKAVGREDALQLVNLIESEGGTILGGDVYIGGGGGIESAYASWHSERRGDESIGSFATRSCAESMSYIVSFPDPPQGLVLFVLVVAEET